MTTFNSDHSSKIATATDISAQDLLDFGIEQVAYIRPIRMMDRKMFAVHGADGTPISIAEDEATALALIASHELDPVRVH